MPVPNAFLFPLLKHWNEETLQQIFARSTQIEFARGSVVCNATDSVDTLFFVCQGALTAYAPVINDKRPFSFGRIGVGQILGLHGLFEPLSYGVHIRAVRDALCVTLPVDDLRSALDANQIAWRSCAAMLSKGVHHLLNYVSMLAESDGYSRLKTMLEMLDSMPKNRPYTPVGILSQREIGERIGLSREMVNRIMKELKLGGFISVDAEGRFRIDKPLPAKF